MMFFLADLLILLIKGLLPSCPCSDWPNSLSLSGLLECKVALKASSWGYESYLDFSKISVMQTVSKTLLFTSRDYAELLHQGRETCVCHSFLESGSFLSQLASVQKQKWWKIVSYPAFLQQNLESWALGGSCCSLKGKQPSLILEYYWCSLVSQQLEASSWTLQQSRKQLDFWWPEVKFEQR